MAKVRPRAIQILVADPAASTPPPEPAAEVRARIGANPEPGYRDLTAQIPTCAVQLPTARTVAGDRELGLLPWLSSDRARDGAETARRVTAEASRVQGVVSAEVLTDRAVVADAPDAQHGLR
jgi:hypothetical protein